MLPELIGTTIDLTAAAEFLAAPAILLVMQNSMKDEVKMLKEKIDELERSKSNNSVATLSFVEDFRKELELLKNNEQQSSTTTDMSSKLDARLSRVEVAMSSTSTVQRLESLEKSLTTLQEADDQSVILQQLIVSDVSSLKSTVSQLSTDTTASVVESAMATALQPIVARLAELNNPPPADASATSLALADTVLELEQRVDQLSSVVSQDATALKDSLTNLSLDLDDSIEQIQQQIESSTQQKVKDLQDRITMLTAKVCLVDNRAGEATEALDSLLEERIARTREAVVSDVTAFEERTTQQVEALASKVTDETRNVVAQVKAAKVETDDKLRELEKGTEEVSRLVEMVDSSVEARAAVVAEAVAVEMSTWNRLSRTVTAAVSATVGVVKSGGGMIVRPIRGVGSAIRHRLGGDSGRDSGRDSGGSSGKSNTNKRRNERSLIARINREE